MAVLPKRLTRFGLRTHPTQTALIAFRKPAARQGGAAGNGTCDLFGLPHDWTKSRRGFWVIKRRTARKRLCRTQTALWRWGRAKRHAPLHYQSQRLCLKLRGHLRRTALAEAVAGRELAKGKTGAHTRGRTQCRKALQRALDRGRQAARRAHVKPMAALWHPVSAIKRLREAYDGLTREAAPGGEGQPWAVSGEHLEANLRALADRRQRGASHARPVQRVDLPQPDGRPRSLGIPALAEKSVPRATVEGLHAMYEGELRGCSSGVRPGRRPQDALEAVTVGLEQRHGNWGLDADIRGVFAASAPAWLLQCMEHRLGDQRVVRHRPQWRHAGVLEAGPWHAQTEVPPQGGRVSPLAAHLSLHDVLDLWADQGRRRYARGDVISVRYAADFSVGFEHQDAAERFWSDPRARRGQCQLELPPEQTRLIECGRCAAERRQRRAQGQPAPCDLRGFTHRCRKTRTGKCTVRRKTIARRLRKQLQAVKATRRQRLHGPIPQPGGLAETRAAGALSVLWRASYGPSAHGMPRHHQAFLVSDAAPPPSAPLDDMAAPGRPRRAVAAQTP